MPFKKWEMPRPAEKIAPILAKECGVSELVASVLVGRGHSVYEDAVRFLTWEGELSSPFRLADMDRAVERVRRAIDGYEKITVYGDYDCDGVTATTILYTYLTSVGADAEYYIPEREGEGYGLNREAIRRIAQNGTRLIVTVDNGISALEEAQYISELGMDLVITDHHQPGETLPQAAAVVNPHRSDDTSPCKELCGAGVAFKLVAALEDGDSQTALDCFADLVAVGTVGDIVPLLGENRMLVQQGLRALSMTSNAGLRALMEVAEIRPESVSAQSVAFGLVPRINAAGRMGSAGLAVRLLLSEDEEEARACALEMNEKNRARQAEETEIMARIEEMLQKDPALLGGRLLILKGAGWNHGIIGIVCSRLLERYGKPVLLLCGEGILRGSGRSLGEFHLFKALSANAVHLLQYGGHKLAAGFSLEEQNFEAFRRGMEDYARQYFDLMPQPALSLDKVLESRDLSLEAVGSLAVLEPFGAQNEPPLFLLQNAVLENAVPLSGGKHLRLSLRAEGMPVSALWFGMSADRFFYRSGQQMDLAVSAEISEYGGRKSVILKVRDARPAGFPERQFFNAKGYYEKLCRREPVSEAVVLRAVPGREETALVYRFLKSRQDSRWDVESLYAQLMKTDINYCKLRILLDILAESGLIALSPLGDQIRLLQTEGKVDLTQTPTARRMQTLYGALEKPSKTLQSPITKGVAE